MPLEINNRTSNTILPAEQPRPSKNVAETAVHNGRKVCSVPKDSIVNNVNIDEIDTKVLPDKLDKLTQDNKKKINQYKVKNIISKFGNFFSTIKDKVKKEKKNKELNKELLCLSDNLMTIAKRFNKEDSEKLFDFSEGCCHGLASNFTLYHQLGIPKEFHKLLLLLCKDQNSGWKFYGKKYTDIGLAIEKAQNKYKENPQTTNSDTLTLLKLRPFAESLLFFQRPETTSMHKTVPRQNTQTVANVLEGDTNNSDILTGSRSYPLALSQHGLTQLLTNLGSNVKKRTSGRIFQLSTGKHILSLKVNPDGYELFDQNIKGFSKYVLKGSEQELSLMINRNLNSTIEGEYCHYEPVFQICEYNLTADKTKEKDYCLPEMIEKITNEETIPPDIKNAGGLTAIHLAALNGSVEDLKRLHENYKTDTNIVNNQGCTALHLASINGHTKAVQYLLDHNYDGNKEQEGEDALGLTPLNFAIFQKDSETAHCILTSDPSTANKQDKHGNTALIYASNVNDIPIMTHLLKIEAVDVNHAAHDGLTPLTIACFSGNIEQVKFLLKQKNIKLDVTMEGKTPLQWAQEKGHTEIAALLKERSRVE